MATKPVLRCKGQRRTQMPRHEIHTDAAADFLRAADHEYPVIERTDAAQLSRTAFDRYDDELRRAIQTEARLSADLARARTLLAALRTQGRPLPNGTPRL
jgi:hypothetical protein